MMVDGHFRHLPIVDHGRVIGMVSMRDLMAWAALRLRHGACDPRTIGRHRRAGGDDPPHAHRRRLKARRLSAVAELVEPVLVEAEEVRELVRDGDLHLAPQLAPGRARSPRRAAGGRA